MAKVVMLIAHEGFRDEELFDTKAELEKAGHKVTVASTALTPARGMIARKAEVDVLLDKVGTEYDAIVFVGGSGAAQFYTNAKAIDLARKYYSANKVVAAICIAPGILAKARILNHRKATCFHGECDQMIEASGGECTGEAVEVDGKIITADGPGSAREFGRAIAAALK